MKTKRLLYLILILIVIPIGLSTRSHAYFYTNIIKEYGGDVLYATLIFFLVRFIAIKSSFLQVATIAYLFCISIETLQLYKEPWLEKIRHTFPFGLILGYGFLWRDWVSYGIGVLIGLLVSLPLEHLLFQDNRGLKS